MAVEVITNRLAVGISWDTGELDGELVQIYAVNLENGDVSNSGVRINKGEGLLTYPYGFEGKSGITVFDNHGNEDSGVILVELGTAKTVEAEAVEPVEAPPDWPDEAPDTAPPTVEVA